MSVVRKRGEAGGKGERAEARLRELKRLIQSGKYETKGKLDLTVSRLLADLRAAAREQKASREGGSGGERP